MLILSVEDRSEEDADDGDEESDGEGGGEATDPRQATFVHVEPVGFPLHQVQELSVQPLTVKVVDGILEWIFVSLFAHTLVATGVETSPLDRNTLEMRHEKRT